MYFGAVDVYIRVSDVYFGALNVYIRVNDVYFGALNVYNQVHSFLKIVYNYHWGNIGVGNTIDSR